MTNDEARNPKERFEFELFGIRKFGFHSGIGIRR